MLLVKFSVTILLQNLILISNSIDVIQFYENQCHSNGSFSKFYASSVYLNIFLNAS